MDIDSKIIKYFFEVNGYKFATNYRNRIVFEKYYKNSKYYQPLYNETTNETERCIFIFELQELKNNLRQIVINVENHFPSGTDFGRNKIRDLNTKPNYKPIEFFAINEFFLDETSGKFYHHKKTISFDKLLKNLYNAHIRPTKIIAGFWLRIKQRIIKCKEKLIGNTINLVFIVIL